MFSFILFLFFFYLVLLFFYNDDSYSHFLLLFLLLLLLILLLLILIPSQFASKNADLIIEVAHPIITKTHGKTFLQHADYFIGSPTALADPETGKIYKYLCPNRALSLCISFY